MSVFVLSLLLACDPSAAPATAPETVLERPQAPPPTHVTGQELAERLAAPSSRIRVVNFWATWCPPCLEELPMLRTFSFRNPDVDVVLVNVDHASVQAGKVPIVMRNHGLESLAHLLLDSQDPNRSLKEHIEGWPEKLPTTLVLSPDGRRVATFDVALSSDVLARAVDRARAAAASGAAQAAPAPR